MNWNKLHNIYLLGIGGIGMSALARYFHFKGMQVAGYDLTPSPLTTELEQAGIDIHHKASVTDIPRKMLDKQNTLVIVTPAIPNDHPELIYFRDHDFTIKKRSEVLGMLFNNMKGIAIAGTHGKTSVTSMSAFIMASSELGCNAFLGGILKNTNSNLILNDASSWVVAEADEYDHSFLHLLPDIALVTWIDADHMDIYLTHNSILESFKKFLEQVKPGGKIILKNTINLNFESVGKQIFTYSLNDTSANFHTLNIQLRQRKYRFDIKTPKETIANIELSYLGLTNVENAVAAAATAWVAGVDSTTIGKALTNFMGVRRRFDVQVENTNCIYIDDYAHHPRELDAFIGSVRKLFSGRKITGIFQPHLYSRTRDFADEFAQSLSQLDELVLLDIYPAREKPIQGVSSKILFDKVILEKKYLCTKKELLKKIEEMPLEVLLTMGAGDIDQFVDPIKKMIAAR